jgi:glucokinase
VAGVSAESVIGVDLGGSKVLAGALSSDLTVHHRAQRPTRVRDQAELVDVIVATVEEARSGSDVEITGVGFGIPCTIDQVRGVAVMAVNLPISDMPFRDVMSERLGLPVFIDNDGNAAALAEQRFGAARGAPDVVMLTIGTGIGGGIILDGNLCRGGRGSGAEVGHVVIDMDGPPCQGACPNRGCLETMASGTALMREAREAGLRAPGSALGRALAAGRPLTGAHVTELAHDGDEPAREVLELLGRRLGVGIASFVNLFAPSHVVVGGGVMAAGDLLLDPAREVVAERALRPAKDMVEIVPAAFGPEAGMVGAAALALDGLARQAARA